MPVNGFELLAIDADGTLLNSQHQVSPGNRAAVRRAVDAGLHVCLCTGRSWTEMRDIIETLDVAMDAAVLGFGSIVVDGRTGQTQTSRPIPPAIADRLVAFFGEAGYPVLALCDVWKAGVDYLMIPGKRGAELYDRWLDMSPCQVERLPAWDRRREVVRLGVLGDRERLTQLADRLSHSFEAGEIKFNLIHAPNYGLDVLECFEGGVNKWTGIEWVCSRLGVAPAAVAAVGDDVNDLEMIESAGMGIAMGNAIEAVKSRAQWITAGHDEDGVAWVVDRLLNGESELNRGGKHD